MADQIRVRMYRIGFGDCFLLSLPVAQDGETAMHHVLVDCGVHAQASLGNVQAIVDDVEKETKGKLAVVIATHQHRDHIYGFGACQESFDRFEIGEVWLPWVDKPDDQRGAQLVRRQEALADRLDAHFSALAAAGNPVSAAAAAALDNLKGNSLAMSNLRGGFARQAKVQYLEAGAKLATPAGILGLAVDVLGPPRDEDFLSDMDEKGIHSYLRGPSDEDEHNMRPFGKWWTYSPERAESEPAFLGLRLTEDDRAALRKELTAPAFEELAFSLDSARNNTSLVLLFRFRGKTLLFPGDAQWGNWHYWLDNLDSQPILEQLDFLKVGHHGSHNASPREAVEKMTSGHLSAMISTQTPKPWETIPRGPLLDRLKLQTGGRYVRSDSLALEGHPESPGAHIDSLPPGFSKGSFWYDYALTV